VFITYDVKFGGEPINDMYAGGPPMMTTLSVIKLIINNNNSSWIIFALYLLCPLKNMYLCSYSVCILYIPLLLST